MTRLSSLWMAGMMVIALTQLTACSTMNDSFSCNKTAFDSCLTMDEVNAMTEEKGTFVKKRVFNSDIQAQSGDALWIAGQDAKE